MLRYFWYRSTDAVKNSFDWLVGLSRRVRNFGVVIDSQIDFKKHVLIIVNVCSFDLRHINKISRYFQ